MQKTMALSYFTESEAPRDFRISSTESEGHYTKCLLCYTVKKNFYCTDCIRAGNFVHSSMPYADRFSEKQAKLLRLKANRKHILDRCEKLLAHKMKRDSLLIEAKQSKDRLDLLRLAIEQRKNVLEERKRQLTEVTQLNTELRLKLPRYQKRVSGLAAHAATQRLELHARHNDCDDKARCLAALRRERARQLGNYIMPVYISRDTCDSIEDMEFLCGEPEETETAARARLHIVTPWLYADGDHKHVLTWAKQNKEAALTAEPLDNPLHRTVAALSLAAQFAALLAWTLDARLPHALTLSEYSNSRVTEAGLSARISRLCACAAALCARANLAPPPPPQLTGLHTLAAAAAADDPDLGRVESWTSDEVAEAAARAAVHVPDEPDPPEHLHWPEYEEEEEVSRSPPAAPAPSLVTSAAGALASMWRGWTK